MEAVTVMIAGKLLELGTEKECEKILWSFD